MALLVEADRVLVLIPVVADVAQLVAGDLVGVRTLVGEDALDVLDVVEVEMDVVAVCPRLVEDALGERLPVEPGRLLDVVQRPPTALFGPRIVSVAKVVAKVSPWPQRLPKRKAPFPAPSAVAGAGFEPATSGL